MNRPSIFGCFNWLLALLCLALSSCAGIGKPLFSTAAGPQDVAGFNQYRLDMPISDLDMKGFTLKDDMPLPPSHGGGKLQIYSKPFELPGSGIEDSVLTLQVRRGVLSSIQLSCEFGHKDWPRSKRLFKLLSAGIRSEYDRSWFDKQASWEDNKGNDGELFWRILMLNDPQLDDLTLTAFEDSITLSVSGSE